MVSSESSDLQFLERLAVVEENVSVWRLDEILLHLPDHGVIKAVPSVQQWVVAEGRVMTHVQVTCVVLEKKNWVDLYLVFFSFFKLMYIFS